MIHVPYVCIILLYTMKTLTFWMAHKYFIPVSNSIDIFYHIEQVAAVSWKGYITFSSHFLTRWCHDYLLLLNIFNVFGTKLYKMLHVNALMFQDNNIP